MSRSWVRPVRDWLFTCRGLILLFYYSQPEVMAALQYDPEAWAREKIQARREALNLTEPVVTPSSEKIPIKLTHDSDD
jgi:hypothetical protein